MPSAARTLLGGRIKCCTLSVRRCVLCFWFTRNRRAGQTTNFTFGGDMTLHTGNWESKFEVWNSKLKVTGNENVKIVFFALIFVKSWPIYIKPIYKFSSAHSIYFASLSVFFDTCLFLIFFLQITQNEASLFNLARHTDTTQCIILHDWTPNHRWSPFVPICNTAIFSRIRYIFNNCIQLALKNCENNIHSTPLSSHSEKHQQQFRPNTGAWLFKR